MPSPACARHGRPRHRDHRRRRARTAGVQAWSRRLGLTGRCASVGPCRRVAAFALGRLLVVPSRAESLPYIVLEAAAAGIPVVATSGRRHPGDFRAADRPAGAAGRSGGAGARDRRRAGRPARRIRRGAAARAGPPRRFRPKVHGGRRARGLSRRRLGPTFSNLTNAFLIFFTISAPGRDVARAMSRATGAQ